MSLRRGQRLLDLRMERMTLQKQLGQEIPFAVQEPDFMSKQILYAENDLDPKNPTVVFNSKLILPGEKQPDPETALKNLSEKSESFKGLPEAKQIVDEVISELKEEKEGESDNYESQIEKLEAARQLVLTDSIYKEKLNELKQKMFIFCTGIVASLVFFSLFAVDKFKNGGTKSS